MRWEALLAACTVGLLVATVGAAERDALPKPWFRTGDALPADKCRTSVADVKARSFDRSLVIRCDGLASGFTSVMQQVAANEFRGKRLRLSAELRGDAVGDWSGLWMRVDGEDGKMLGFDNMVGRNLHGTFDWLPVAVVLDVPANATRVAFGFLQSGNGASFAGAIKLEPVGADVQTTDMTAALPKRPANLSLKE